MLEVSNKLPFIKATNAFDNLPLVGLTAKFDMARLANVAEHLSYTGPATPSF